MMNTLIAATLVAFSGSIEPPACSSSKSACSEKSAAACEGTKANSINVALVEGDKDIVDVAVGAGQFNTLAAALKAAGLVDTLKGKGPFTVFAPTDEAFAKLPKGTLENLLKPENKAALAGILTYHVVSGNVQAADVVKLTNATTVNGQRIDIKARDGKVMVDGANVVKTDIAASNGTIHVIDAVILPASKDLVETAVEAGSFSTLAKALKAAGLVDTLKRQTKDGFTVFAPTDDAFAKLPKGTLEDLLKPENKDKLAGILTYHVVPGRVYADQVGGLKKATTAQGTEVMFKLDGSKAMINNATITATDIEASNDVIHVIDSVILPK